MTHARWYHPSSYWLMGMASCLLLVDRNTILVLSWVGRDIIRTLYRLLSRLLKEKKNTYGSNSWRLLVEKNLSLTFNEPFWLIQEDKDTIYLLTLSDGQGQYFAVHWLWYSGSHWRIGIPSGLLLVDMNSWLVLVSGFSTWQIYCNIYSL